MRVWLVAGLAVVVASMFALVSRDRGSDAAALATATPSATAAPTSTPIPPSGTYLRVRVVNDANRNGAADGDEKGLEGWRLAEGCGDAFLQLGPTDPYGYAVVPFGSNREGPTSACVRLEREAGWLPTSPDALQIPITDGHVNDGQFLLHFLGPSAMEVGFSIVIAGIPMTDTTISLAPPFSQCIERVNSRYSPYIIVGAADRDACPGAGAEIGVMVDGVQAGVIVFAPGVRLSTYPTLVIGGDSMRLSVGSNGIDGTWEVTGAVVRGRDDCAVIEPRNDFPIRIGIFVLSEEARPGCAREGDLVRFYRNGVALEPALPWSPGIYRDGAEFRPSLTPPDTGSGGYLDSK